MPKRILVVDDERHIVRLCEVNLRRAGYEVVTAFGGREALEKVRTEMPNLLVLDAMMPQIDGFEVLKKLKGEPTTAALPVLMLTARPALADAPRVGGVISAAWLTKPFSPLDLLQCVREMLGLAPLQLLDPAEGAE